MLTSHVYPVRRSVGRRFPVVHVELVDHAPDLDPAGIQTFLRATPDEATQSNAYGAFLPPFVLLGPGTAPPLANEAARYRMPSDLPFGNAGDFASIFIAGPRVASIGDGRRLWAEFELSFVDPDDKSQPPRVGGIVLGGFPYMPSYLDAQGEPSANHGLPRELRLSWSSAEQEGYIDDQTSLTRQLPAWHSNYHVVETGPVVSGRLRVRVSDLGRRFASMRSWDPDRGRYEEHWGCAIPFLYVYEYEERGEQRPDHAPGVVAALQSTSERKHSYFAAALEDTSFPDWNGAESAYLLFRNQQLYPFTAASAVLPRADRRRYPIAGKDQRIHEFFVSNRMKAGDEVRLHLAQREENERCIAGLEIEFADDKQAEIVELGDDAPLALRVYEVDPLPGSPAVRVATDPAGDRFHRLLGETSFDTTRGRTLRLRFQRVTRARHLCVAIVAPHGGYVAIDRIAFIRSAHVAVQPRPSRSQLVRAMHFRLIGQGLGEDYAQLGERGFSLSVDRVAAGERRERLFHAHSLEELVRSGVGQLLTNSRSRAAERQHTTVLPGSWMETRNRSRSDGWDRSESGIGVTAPTAWGQPGSSMAPDGEHGFTQMGSEESRTHVSHVASVPKSFRDRVGERFSWLPNRLTPNADRLRDNGSGGWWAPWRALSTTRREWLEDELDVDGLWNVSIPPYFNRLLNDVDDLDNMGQIQHALSENTGDLFLINGAGIGASMGLSAVLANWSWSNNVSSSGVASALQAHSTGSTGSVLRTGRQSDYSYSQSLTAQASTGTTRTDYEGGKHHQLLLRETADGTPVENARIRGAEIMWNERVTDLIIGTVQLGIELRAVNDPVYRTTDDALRVSFGRIGPGIEVDVWFDVEEEVVRDDS